jgi:hypothetical protein
MEVSDNAANSINEDEESNYDRGKEVKAFEETKACVKELVDSGVSNIPRIFVHPLEKMQKSSSDTSNISIQVSKIVFEGFKNSLRTEVLMNQWIHDPPLCGAIIVNIGDFMQVKLFFYN